MVEFHAGKQPKTGLRHDFRLCTGALGVAVLWSYPR